MRLSLMYPCTRYLASAGQLIVWKSVEADKAQSFSCLVPTKKRFLAEPSSSYIYFPKARMSLCRQNYPEECEAGLNRQINMELYASYVYTSMAYHFDRDDVALPGFHAFFKKLSKEERKHAELLMKYQNSRGGRVVLQDIKKPEGDAWGTGLEAMMATLKLEKHVNQSLIELHQIAQSKNDAQLEDFLEDEFLKDQVDSIKMLSDFVTQLTRVGSGLGEYMFDKETLQERDHVAVNQ